MDIDPLPSARQNLGHLSARSSAEEIIDRLELEPLPLEGGYFRRFFLSETGRSRQRFTSAIYYLITSASFSALHRLEGSEIWLFHQGDPSEQLCLAEDGSWEERVYGPDLYAGQLQAGVVDPRVWQGMRLIPGGSYALFSCVVTPAFEHEAFEMGDPERLIAAYPHLQTRIREFCHAP